MTNTELDTSTLVTAIGRLVAYNWRDEETDYNRNALEPGNSREGHIFRDLMLIQCWLEANHGYPHVEPRIENEHVTRNLPGWLAWNQEAERKAREAGLLNAARDWIADCQWAGDIDVAKLSDDAVRAGIQVHYDGGWAQFIADGA